MQISVLSPQSIYTNSRGLMTPLLLWKNNLKKININVKFFKESFKLSEGDILIVDSKYHRFKWANNVSKIYIDFIKFKKKFNKIIYCDTADSSGWIQKEIFDYVDQYWKAQILKNKKKYYEKMYDRRIYTDFYFKNYNIFDNDEDFSDTNLEEKDLNKIKVFWNTSLSDFSKNSHLFNRLYHISRLRYFLKFKRNKLVDFDKKNLDLFSRFNVNNYRATINFHRQETLRVIKNKYELNIGKISRKNYYEELLKSKISISPFGWGEIAYRDYESFISKTLLLKPNLDHMLTWPNLFIKNETYIDFNWNFDNLNAKIEMILDNYNHYQSVVENAYDTYKKFTYNKNAHKIFINHFSKLVKSV